MKDSPKHIIVIMDELDDYSSLLKFNDPDVDFHSINFENLGPTIKSVDKGATGELKTVLVARWDFIDDKKYKTIKDFFANDPRSIHYRILYLAADNFDFKTEPEKIIKEFVYYLPQAADGDKLYTLNLASYISILFQLLSHEEKIDDYIVSSFRTIVDKELINNQKIEIEKLNKKLQELSRIDYLTNILNRRAFFNELDKEMKRTMRFLWRMEKDLNITSEENQFIDRRTSAIHKPKGTIYDHNGRFSCILMDIDHFKTINDTKGHLTGDMVLQKIGVMLRSNSFLRDTDSAGRYGGEEFIILLPETNVQNAKVVAERLNAHISKEAFYDLDGNEFHISASMGLTEFKVTDKTNDQIINRADQALYSAKNKGRGLAVVYEEMRLERNGITDT